MVTNHQPAPTIARFSLGESLRQLRENKGMTRADAGAAISYSRDTIRKIELGQQATKPSIVRDLCRIYGASPNETSRLCGYAVEGAERGMWERGGASPEFRAFVDVETVATRISSFEPEYIPGLLQTTAYLRAVQAARLPNPDEDHEAIQRLRARRQDVIIDGDDPPDMYFVIGPAALIYLDALPDVRDEQIARLLKLDAKPHIHIRVITGLHAAMDGPFTIMVPGDGASGIREFVYVEAVDGCRYVEDKDVVSQFERTFAALYDGAKPIKEYINYDREVA